MADNQLNIIVKVAGQREFNELVQKQIEGNITHGEQIRLRKLAHEMWLKTGADISAEAVESKNLVAARELVSASANKVLTANGKMMQSYFRLGNQIRSGVFGVMQGMPPILRGVVVAGDEVMERLEILGSRGVSRVDALKQVFSGGTGLVVGIGLAITALTLLIQKLNDTTEAQKSLKREMEALHKAMRRMNKEQVEDAKKRAEVELKELEGAQKPKTLNLPGAVGVATNVALSYIGDLFSNSPEVLQQRIEAKKKLIQDYANWLEEKQNESVDKYIENEQKIHKDAMKRAQEAKTKVPDMLKVFGGWVDKDAAKKQKQFEDWRASTYGLDEKGKPRTTKDFGVKHGKDVEPFKDVKVKFNAFQDTVIGGVMDMSSLISNNLSQAWQRSFGEANSVAEQFFMRMAQMLADLAVKFALAFAIDNIFFGGAPVTQSAYGLTGRSVGSGSSVSSTTMELARSTFGGGVTSSSGMQLKTKISGSDLWIIVEKGKRQTSTRLVQ